MPAFKQIDPADLKYRVSFILETTLPDGYGGVRVIPQPVLSTWAAKDQPSTTLSYNDLLALQAGAQVMKADVVVTIRHRKDFMPDKSMRFTLQGDTYMITSVAVLGEPAKYVRVVGKKAE